MCLETQDVFVLQGEEVVSVLAQVTRYCKTLNNSSRTGIVCRGLAKRTLKAVMSVAETRAPSGGEEGSHIYWSSPVMEGGEGRKEVLSVTETRAFSDGGGRKPIF